MLNFSKCFTSGGGRAGQLLQSRQGHRQGIQDVALSPSGRLAVTASDDGTCKVFDIVD